MRKSWTNICFLLLKKLILRIKYIRIFARTSRLQFGLIVALLYIIHNYFCLLFHSGHFIARRNQKGTNSFKPTFIYFCTTVFSVRFNICWDESKNPHVLKSRVAVLPHFSLLQFLLYELTLALLRLFPQITTYIGMAYDKTR